MAGLVAVIDYGLGNLHSVVKALEHVTEATVVATSRPELILKADRVVFPGQSAIKATMRALENRGLSDVVMKTVREKPFFGMCIGPQALMQQSEENGGVQGLGVIPGQVLKFPSTLRDSTGARLKIPHMGWNRVRQTQKHILWSDIEDGAWFYFVHSYYLSVQDAEFVAGTTEHGITFPVAIQKDNIFAVQFHPEKSSKDGLTLLKNFCVWSP